MADAKAIGLSELAKFGFVQLSETVPKLDALVKLVGDAGRATVASLAKAADSDAALNHLLYFAEQDKPRIKKLLAKADIADRLCRVLGASEGLVDFLRRQPAAFAEFEKPVAALRNQREVSQIFRDAVSPTLVESTPASTAWCGLRVAYRRELLRVAIFDISQPNAEAGLPIVAAALSDLAGAALDVAIDIARFELKASTEFGNFTKAEIDATRLSVIAMGKCGARELNYISDVDVIFVAESGSSDLETTRALDVATKLATRMMRALDATASEPGLWQVDPNLRPEGKSGALVRTLESHRAYYERWAESWEFQALLKARPIAGDTALGQAYFDAMSPFVWQSAGRENFVESAQRMRERVTTNIAKDELDWQIKLGPGGLRDVEFTVQLLQLVHGRTDETVRTQDTLSSLRALAAAGYIGRQEAETFSAHYRFLRLLEHRIQLTQLRRTHLMPKEEAKQRVLARSVGVGSSAEALVDRWQAVKLDVRTLHQKLFYRPLLSAVAKLPEGGLELTSDQAQDRLRAIGFADPKGALSQISALSGGLSRRAAIQKQLLPVLIQWFADGTDPDSALLAFRRLSEDLGESHWYLRMLRDSSGAAQRMTVALSNSKLVQDLLEKVPEGAAWFEDAAALQPLEHSELSNEFAALAERHDSKDAVAAAIRSIRRRETLRLALGAILGDLTIEQIYAGLTDLSEAYLGGMLKVIYDFDEGQIADRPIVEVLDFCIVAMGRFGGAEVGFGSDADVMYVYEKTDLVNGEYAQRVAERVIAELKRLTQDPILEFELDIDLRPEGKNGAVVRSLESYAAYYERWVDHWEAQALTRARVIAGSDGLAAKFTELINVYRYPKRMTAEALGEIRRIKARVETERLPMGADPRRHLKLGRGSLSDVEWLVQVYQMRFGDAHPSIRSPRTLVALEACVAEGILEAHDARVLEEAWTLASRARSALMLWANKRSDVLPTDRRQLEGMARILEYPRGSATQLEEDYLGFTRRARSVFERLFYSPN